MYTETKDRMANFLSKRYDYGYVFMWNDMPRTKSIFLPSEI